MRIACFTDNGFARCSTPVRDAVHKCADFLANAGHEVEERRPPCVEQAFDLEFGLLGADGVDGIDEYLRSVGSMRVHPLLTGWLDRMRPLRATASQLAQRWAEWDEYRAALARFFAEFDAVLCPVYTQPALPHGESLREENFRGFSYTMAWNVAGAPAATVRCADTNGLPINVQVATPRWRDMDALHVAALIEEQFGGWRPPTSAPVRS